MRLIIAGVAIAAWLAGSSVARAANGAYQVEAADISDVGSCKIESWLSGATNTDFSAVANPSCVVDPGHPIELSVQANRARSGGDWSNTLAPKLKTNIVPTAIGRFGYSIEAAAAVDAITGTNTSMLVTMPATYRLSVTMRVNLNAGWFWDRVLDQHYLSYGSAGTGSSPRRCNSHWRASACRARPTRRARSSRGPRPACAGGPMRYSLST